MKNRPSNRRVLLDERGLEIVAFKRAFPPTKPGKWPFDRAQLRCSGTANSRPSSAYSD